MQSLENHFLIAMPSMQDPFFKHAVTYICEHNQDGAMGLVINQPINITVGELLDKIEIDNDKSQDAASLAVYVFLRKKVTQWVASKCQAQLSAWFGGVLIKCIHI